MSRPVYAVRLGRAQLGRTIYARGEDQVTIIAPQRTNKTGILADRVSGDGIGPFNAAQWWSGMPSVV